MGSTTIRSSKFRGDSVQVKTLKGEPEIVYLNAKDGGIESTARLILTLKEAQRLRDALPPPDRNRPLADEELTETLAAATKAVAPTPRPFGGDLRIVVQQRPTGRFAWEVQAWVPQQASLLPGGHWLAADDARGTARTFRKASRRAIRRLLSHLGSEIAAEMDDRLALATTVTVTYPKEA